VQDISTTLKIKGQQKTFRNQDKERVSGAKRVPETYHPIPEKVVKIRLVIEFLQLFRIKIGWARSFFLCTFFLQKKSGFQQK
jgi:hypothetical protein